MGSGFTVPSIPNSALRRSEWSVSGHCCSSMTNSPLYPLKRSLGGPQNTCGWCEEEIIIIIMKHLD
jgi:hypothetical protein